MKFKIIKNYNGNVELIYGENVKILSDNEPEVILTEKEYESIPKHKQYLITNQFILVEFVEEEVVKETKVEKKK